MGAGSSERGWGSALEGADCGADRDVLGQHLDDLWVDSLLREVPRLDLVVLVVAQRRKDGAPAPRAQLVVAEAVSRHRTEHQGGTNGGGQEAH